MKKNLIFGFVIAMSIPGLYADAITINSSAAVTFLNSNSTTTDFTAPFTTANFTAAQTGTAAAVLSSVPFYLASLPAAPTAQWIGVNSGTGTNAGDTALYAVSFNIPDPFLFATLSLSFAVDNELGGTNPGIYLNGIALANSTGIPGTGTGSFTTQNTYTNASVAPDLVQGTNWLYLDDVNLGAEAGLIFSANISTVNAPIGTPEPASFVLIGAGLLAAGVLSRRKK
jgi:hypothetical protein